MDSHLQRAPAEEGESRPRPAARDSIVVASPERLASEVEFGSGWYHDAAIKESQQAQASHP